LKRCKFQQFWKTCVEWFVFAMFFALWNQNKVIWCEMHELYCIPVIHMRNHIPVQEIIIFLGLVHGGNLHHPDTKAIKGRCIRINFILAVWQYTFYIFCVTDHDITETLLKVVLNTITCTLVMGRTVDLPSVFELAPCKYKRVYFYFDVQKNLITY
jgi:hypothetical protein